jgi:hypothetical protein
MNYRLALVMLVSCSRDDGWHELSSQDGHYRAELPGPVVEHVEKQLTLPTVTENHLALVDRGARGSFQISYYELVATIDAQTAGSAAQLDCLGPFVGSELAITEQRAQPLGTAPGYIIVATAPISTTHPKGAFETLWCVVDGTRMFHVLAIGPDTPEQHADTTRFIASFRLGDR